LKPTRTASADPRDLLALQRGLTGDRPLAGRGYMDDPALLAAYDDYYRHVSQAQASRACDFAGLHPRSVLDMGAGPGSMSLAFAQRGARSFALVDSSADALRRARASLADSERIAGEPFSVTATVADLESPDAVPDGPYDLAVFGHCLNELGTGEDRIGRRLAVVDRAAASLSPGGAVLVIEPATLAASRDALALRDGLLDAGWQVRAPCTFAGACPALLAGLHHTCHDEAAWDVPSGVKRLADAAGLDRDLIKMTWFIAAPPHPTSSGAVRGTCFAGVSGGERLVSTESRGDYRVVSAPMLNKGGRVRYLICGPAGRFPFSARKDDQAARQAGFFDFRRYDLLRISSPEIREGGWGFGPSTRLGVLPRPAASN